MIKISKIFKRSNLLVIIGLSIGAIFSENFLIGSSYVSAQPLQIEVVADAAANLLDWFNELLNQVNTIADKEDKRRLIKSLTLLNKQIYELENDSRHLLTVLERNNPAKSEVQQAVDDTRESWRQLNEQFDNVGFEVRSLTGLDKPNIEFRTREAIISRKANVAELDEILQDNETDYLCTQMHRCRIEVHAFMSLKSSISKATFRLSRSSIALFEIVEKLEED